MVEPLPTYSLGIAEDIETERAIAANVATIVDQFNEVPRDIFIRVLMSVVTTICVSQEDPHGLYEHMGKVVGSGLRHWLSQPAGNA